MPTYLAFLRAVNVRPRWVPMARVTTLLAAHGYADVVTYIQSGNVRVTTSTPTSARAVAEHLRTVLSQEFGFDIPAIVRTPAQLRELVGTLDAAPAPTDDARPYVAFLGKAPSSQACEELERWDRPGERAQVLGSNVALWLGLPFSHAKLNNAAIERIAGVATTRDLKVLRTLVDTWS